MQHRPQKSLMPCLAETRPRTGTACGNTAGCRCRRLAKLRPLPVPQGADALRPASVHKKVPPSPQGKVNTFFHFPHKGKLNHNPLQCISFQEKDPSGTPCPPAAGALRQADVNRSYLSRFQMQTDRWHKAPGMEKPNPVYKSSTFSAPYETKQRRFFQALSRGDMRGLLLRAKTATLPSHPAVRRQHSTLGERFHHPRPRRILRPKLLMARSSGCHAPPRTDLEQHMHSNGDA